MSLPSRGSTDERQRDQRNERSLPTFDEVRTELAVLQRQNSVRLHQLFEDEEVHRICAELKMEFRERVFTPAITLGLFVAQVLSRGDACTTVMAKFNRDRKARGLPAVSEDASAYSKARSRLPVQLMTRLNEQVRKMSERLELDDWKWKGLSVYLVDGFVLRAPDTAANQEKYPQPSSQKDGLGFPQVRVVTSTSLATGSVVHHNTARVEGAKTGEVSLFREKHEDFKEGDVILADSNFESFHDAVLLNRRGVHMVCAINGTRNSPFEGPCSAIEEQIMDLPKPTFHKDRFTRRQWKALPPVIRYRLIRFQVAGRDKPLTIVTTLTDRQRFKAEEIVELYGWRWDVEVDIRSYKSSMGMCELRCLTPENLEREIATAVLGYNLVRVLMCDTAAVVKVHPREISFSSARDAWLTFHDELETPADLAWAIHSTASHLVRQRPGRNEPRAIKRRNMKYPRLKEPRPNHRCRKKSTKYANPSIDTA